MIVRKRTMFLETKRHLSRRFETPAEATSRHLLATLAIGLTVAATILPCAPTTAADSPAQPDFDAAARQCRALGGTGDKTTTIEQATFEFPRNFRLVNGEILRLPAHCAVQAVTRQSAGSAIHFA